MQMSFCLLASDPPTKLSLRLRVRNASFPTPHLDGRLHRLQEGTHTRQQATTADAAKDRFHVLLKSDGKNPRVGAGMRRAVLRL